MTRKIEEILIEKIKWNYIENKEISIILMTYSDFKLLISEINNLCIIPYKEDVKGEKRYMGLKIYITEDLSKGEIIVK